MVWILGSIWGISWKYVIVVFLFIVIFMGIIIYKFKYIDVLNLGDEVFISFGVDVEK